MLATIDILIWILLGIVFLILMAGIYTLFRGGEVSRSWSNKLMRARVLFQFITIVVILFGFWLSNQLGGG